MVLISYQNTYQYVMLEDTNLSMCVFRKQQEWHGGRGELMKISRRKQQSKQSMPSFSVPITFGKHIYTVSKQMSLLTCLGWKPEMNAASKTLEYKSCFNFVILVTQINQFVSYNKKIWVRNVSCWSTVTSHKKIPCWVQTALTAPDWAAAHP